MYNLKIIAACNNHRLSKKNCSCSALIVVNKQQISILEASKVGINIHYQTTFTSKMMQVFLG